MDPVTLQLILAGLSVGAQAAQAFAVNRSLMTAEQQAEARGCLDRITAAQNLVTPYEKEKGGQE